MLKYARCRTYKIDIRVFKTLINLANRERPVKIKYVSEETCKIIVIEQEVYIYITICNIFRQVFHSISNSFQVFELIYI